MTLDSSGSSSNNDEVTTSTITENLVQVSNTTTKEKEEEDLCPICSAPCITSCRSCKKVSYCSKAHQKLHFKEHKPQCYPIIHQYDEILGSRLIVTRNIKAGEIILRERPLVSGPKITCVIKSVKEDEKSILCVGCLEDILLEESNYFCPTCSWPVCGSACKNYAEHEENECKIFASSKIKPSALAHLDLEGNEEEEDGKCKSKCEYYYGVITILRGVLLKERDPLKWQKLLKLDASNSTEKVELHNNIPTKYMRSQFISFIKNCNLPQVTDEDVELVVRVMSFRVFEIYHDSSNKKDLFDRKRKSFSYLYCIANGASQSCIPNSSWVIQLENSEIHLRALVPIQFGRTITLSYADVTYGIMDRQRKLVQWKSTMVGLSSSSSTCLCECERCSDPTELSTFYSAIKCPVDHSSGEGWLLPVVRSLLPSKENEVKKEITEWTCTECGIKKPSDYYRQILSLSKKELSESSRNISLENNNPFDSIEKLEEICEKYSSVTLHPNHFLLYSIEIDILRRISNLLTHKTWTSCDEIFVRLVGRLIQICKKWLQVADILWPGLTRQRGILLYYTQQGMIINMLIKISINMRQRESSACNSVETDFSMNDSLEKEFLKILSIRKEVLQIFCLETDGSEENNIAQDIAQGCPEIKILKRCIDSLQKQ